MPGLVVDCPIVTHLIRNDHRGDPLRRARLRLRSSGADRLSGFPCGRVGQLKRSPYLSRQLLAHAGSPVAHRPPPRKRRHVLDYSDALIH